MFRPSKLEVCPRLAVATVLSVAMMLAASHAWASTTPDQMQSLGYLPNIWVQVKSKLDASIAGALDSSKTYYRWCHFIFLANVITIIVYNAAKYAFKGLPVINAIEIGIKLGILSLGYIFYTTWTKLVFNASLDLGQLLQGAALGTTDWSGPWTYLTNVFLSYTVPGFSVLGVTLLKLVFGALFLIMQLILSFAAFFASSWPMVIYTLSTLVGPVFFAFALYEPTSFLFDGWFRWFAHACVYAFFGRAVLVASCLICSVAFATPYSTQPLTLMQVLDPTDWGMMFVFFAMALMSILLILLCGKFSGMVAGGGDMSLSKAVGEVVKTVSRAVQLSGVLKA
ncbi:MAG TPA: hypothetical protein VGU69_10400 [Rhizomicrobium sp.]|nr:hypothetical protein [Rhizomicrobium sp.]